MNIAILARQFPLVSETFVLDHITGLIERGHGVRVYCRTYREQPPRHADLDAFGIRQRVTEWLPAGSAASAAIRALRALASTGPRALVRAVRTGVGHLPRDTLLIADMLRRQLATDAICHAHFGPLGEQLALLRRIGLLDRPLVVSLHGYDATQNPAALRAHYRHLFQGSDRIVVTTGFMAEQALALGCPAARLVRLPLGIRLDRFPLRPVRADTTGPVRVLSIARLVEKKGIEFGVRAMADLKRRGLAVRYRIVGDGPRRAALEALAAELGVADRVEFAGALSREQTRAELLASDLFLFPSVQAQDGDREGQGMALIEAQASGIPCVASRSGGIPEVLRDGGPGRLVAERDAPGIAEAVAGLIAERSHWEALGREGRAWVAQHFDLDRHLKGLEPLYQELCASAGPRHD